MSDASPDDAMLTTDKISLLMLRPKTYTDASLGEILPPAKTLMAIGEAFEFKMVRSIISFLGNIVEPDFFNGAK